MAIEYSELTVIVYHFSTLGIFQNAQVPEIFE